MARFELDRLFGLALTDDRFFRHLCERPHQAMLQFDLTEPETQAVLNIAPKATSVQELATQLDSWMTSNALTAALRPVLEPATAELRLSAFDPNPDRQGYPHLFGQETIHITTQGKEQGLCLKLSEYIAQN
jgi:hypothetical protein